MAADPFRRVSPGERLRVSAVAYNAMLEAAEAHKRPTAFGAGDAPGGEPAGVLLAKNTTEDMIDRFRLVGFDGPLLAGDAKGFLDRPCLKARKPTADDHTIFGVTQERIPAGKIGRVMVAGLTYLRVSVQHDDDQFAFVEAATHLAKSTATGPIQLIGVPTGGAAPEDRWCIARIPVECPEIIVKTDAAHAKGASGTVSLYEGGKGAETDTTRNLTSVYNRYADLATGKWATAKRFGQGVELIAGEC
jgi:hypothetical protein